MNVHKEVETRIAVHSLRATGTSAMFRANVPEYEGAHSGLRTEIQCQENRSVQYNAGTTESLGRLFGDLTNCTIGSLTVNVRPIFNVQSA